MPDWKVEKLGKHHDRNLFECGNETLTRWFRQNAGQFDERDLARTYVLVGTGHPALIGGYYSISSCQIRYKDLPPNETKRLARNLVIPAALIGKLAIQKDQQGKGLGSALLINAFQRILHASNDIAMRVVVVDAIDDSARKFYLKHQFTAFPDHPDRLFISIHIIRGLRLDPLPD
jgi:GNAT superfamily N-acetyltransferase